MIPDYILWIMDGAKQYISFIDPKGIKLLEKNIKNPKIEFGNKIKELEARLQPITTDKTIILNSFILSGTPAREVRSFYGLSSIKEIEDKNVFFLEQKSECIDKMINKIVEKAELTNAL